MPERLQLGAPHERPRLLLRAGDQRRRRILVAVLAERQRRRLAHARIGIGERAAQGGAGIDPGRGRQPRELAGRQVAQHRLVAVLAHVRQRGGIARAAQRPQRHHRAAAHLEAPLRRQRRAQRADHLAAPARIPLEHGGQGAQQVCLAGAAVVWSRGDRGQHRRAGELGRAPDRGHHRRAHRRRPAPQRAHQHLAGAHIVEGAQHAGGTGAVLHRRLFRGEQRGQR